jgi:hypothetical protein
MQVQAFDKLVVAVTRSVSDELIFGVTLKPKKRRLVWKGMEPLTYADVC